VNNDVLNKDVFGGTTYYLEIAGWDTPVAGISRTLNLNVDFTPAAPPSAPEIDVQRPGGSSILDSSTDNIGAQSVSRVNLTYTIDNTAGTDQLSVTDVSASGLTHVGDFSLDTVTPISIAAGTTATFDISFDVDANSAFSLDIDIVNNDSDEDLYDIQIMGSTGFNDDFDDAITITSFPHSSTLEITNATTAADDPVLSPCANNQKVQSVWYKFTPPGDGSITINTSGSNYETISALWTGTRGSLSNHVCMYVDALEANVAGGTTYYLEIAGWDTPVVGISRTLNLRVTFTP